MGDSPTFSIPKDVIEPIIQAHVASAVTAALGGEAHLTEIAIAQVLNSKVDTEGKPERYSDSRSITYIQWAMRDVVKKAVLAALQEEFAKHQKELRAMLVTELTKKNSKLVKQLVEGMVGAITNGRTLRYNLTVTVGE